MSRKNIISHVHSVAVGIDFGMTVNAAMQHTDFSVISAGRKEAGIFLVC
jgi:hypothetical protein